MLFAKIERRHVCTELITMDYWLIPTHLVPTFAEMQFVIVNKMRFCDYLACIHLRVRKEVKERWMDR